MVFEQRPGPGSLLAEAGEPLSCSGRVVISGTDLPWFYTKKIEHLLPSLCQKNLFQTLVLVFSLSYIHPILADLREIIFNS